MARKDDSKARAGTLFHMVSKDDLKPGDHIYVWRAAGLYSHHGIYVGERDMEVIHFSGDAFGKLLGAVSIQSCTLEEFQEDAWFINLVAYDISPITALFKRGETAHVYKSRPGADVVKTAKDLKNHPSLFGEYNALFKNCESFAIYCKTFKAMPSSKIIPFSTFIEGMHAIVDEI